MKNILHIISCTLLFCFSFKAQTNVDFEQTPVGSYTAANAVSGWTVSSRTANGVCPVPTNSWNPGSNEFSIVATPINGILPPGYIIPHSPLGGTNVARLNNSIANANQTRIAQTFVVTNSNSLLQFAYAGYWEDGGGGHNCCQQPGFLVQQYDINGNLLACSALTLIPNTACQSAAVMYTVIPGVACWSNWQLKYIDLSPFIGTTVKIEFTTMDCSIGDHYGTTLIDVKLLPACPAGSLDCPFVGVSTASFNPVSYCPGSNIATITGPYGYVHYQWISQGILPGPIPAPQGTMSTLSVINPIVGSVYTLTTISVAGCHYAMTYTIQPSTVAIFGVGASSSCVNGSSGSATVLAIGSSIGYNYTWLNSSNSIVGNQSVISNLAPDVYKAVVQSAAGSGCGTSTITTTVGIAPPSVTKLFKPYCGNVAYLSVGVGASNIKWYNASGSLLNSGVPAYTITSPVNNGTIICGFDSSYGCRDSVEYTLLVSTPGVVNVSNIKYACPGINNSSAVVSVTPVSGSLPGQNSFLVTNLNSSTPAYNVSVNPTIYNTYSLNGLSAGNYSVQVYDGACHYNTTFTVSDYVFNYNVSPNNVTLCPGNISAGNIIFTSPPSQTQYTYSWSPSTFLLPGTANQQNTIITPTVALGQSLTVIYTVVVTPSLINCPLTKTMAISIINPTPPLIAPITNSFCNSSSPSTISVFPPGGVFTSGVSGTNSPISATGGILTPSLANGGIHTFTYTTFTGTCPARSTGSFFIYGPQLVVTGGNTICAQQIATLTASGANTYTWMVWPVQNNSSVFVSPAATMGYTLLATDASNCITKSVVPVYVRSLPVISIAGNNTVCSGQSASLTASGANTYTWSNGSTGSSITITPSTSTVYSIQGMDQASCASSGFININIVQFPYVNISGQLNSCRNQTIFLSASGASTFSWSTGATTPTISVPADPFNSIMTFTVMGSNALNCSHVAGVAVKLKDCYTSINSDTRKTTLLKIYPNPFSTFLVIETEEEIELEFINELAILVFKKKLETGKLELDLSFLTAGIYIAKVRTQGAVEMLKLVKSENKNH